MIKNRQDFQLGVGLTFFCLLLLFFLIPQQVGPLNEADALMPVIMTVLILILSLALIIKAVRLPSTAHHQPDPVVLRRRQRTIAMVILLMVVYAWLLELLGFMLVACMAMVILFLLFNVTDWKKISLVTGITVIALYIIFEQLFSAPLPAGTLFEQFIG
jgi:hypothetical protein